MASQTNYTVLEIDTDDQSSTPSSSSSTTPHGWWSRPIVTVPPCNVRAPTCTEEIACFTPFCTGIFTVFAVYNFFLHIDQNLPNANFSIQSIAISPSNVTMWHVDFLVKSPRSRYFTYFDEASVKLGPLEVAVLNVSCRRESRDVTVLSLIFIVEDRSGKNDVYEQLDVKLRAMHKRYVDHDEAGYLDVQCHKFTRNHENNIDKKIICQSSFIPLKMFLVKII